MIMSQRKKQGGLASSWSVLSPYSAPCRAKRAACLRRMGESRHLELWQCATPGSLQRPIISCCGASSDRHQLKLYPWQDAHTDCKQSRRPAAKSSRTCMTNPVVVRYRRNIDVWCMRCFGETHARRIVVDERCIAVALTDTCMVIATRVYDFVHYAAQGPCVAKRGGYTSCPWRAPRRCMAVDACCMVGC